MSAPLRGIGIAMSQIEVGHIRSNCEERFTALIDMSDVKNRKPSDQTKTFLSRALAAFAIADLAGVDDEAAADAIVDEPRDDGIDAFYYDPTLHRTYLVQSKWSKNGGETIDVGSVLKFIQGFRHVIAPKHDALGPKLLRKSADLKAALKDTKNHFALVIAYTGEEEMSREAKQPFDELTSNVNRNHDWASVTTLRQRDLHEMVAKRSLGDPIVMDVLLHEWGAVKKPYEMYYGQVSAADIADWGKYGDRLYDRNLRKFKGSTDVNDDILGTLQKHPDNFLYFNNGITVVSSSVDPSPHGVGTPVALFKCVDASVVNGAQTVGSIVRAYQAESLSGTSTARVLVRLVSLKDCPQDFGDELTKAANTQNKVEKRDFAAQDSQQERLMRELFLSYGKRYIYKPGEADVPGQPDNCLIDEAAVALACAHTKMDYCMVAKREVSKLYDDIKRTPYKAIFNPSVRAFKLWRAVLVMRLVDEHLRQYQADPTERTGLIAVHGNRFILHLVFRRLGEGVLDEEPSRERIDDVPGMSRKWRKMYCGRLRALLRAFILRRTLGNYSRTLPSVAL